MLLLIFVVSVCLIIASLGRLILVAFHPRSITLPIMLMWPIWSFFVFGAFALAALGRGEAFDDLSTLQEAGVILFFASPLLLPVLAAGATYLPIGR